MAHEAEGEMSPHPMTDDRHTADDALAAAVSCLRGRCEHQPTGYGKEYDDHRESAIRAYGDARVREVLERVPCHWRTDNYDADDEALDRCDPEVPCPVHHELAALDRKEEA